jgi:hypothetical protein
VEDLGTTLFGARYVLSIGIKRKPYPIHFLDKSPINPRD